MKKEKTIISTVHLKEILKQKPLTFRIPGDKADNYLIDKIGKKNFVDLKVSVHPKYNRDKHFVYINGILEDLLRSNNQYKEHPFWFKNSKESNQWFRDFIADWRYLLDLNKPEPSNGYDFIGKYIVGNIPKLKEEQKRKAVHPLSPNPNWPNKYVKHRIVIHPRNNENALVCVKDLVTKEIIRITKKEAKLLIPAKEHLKYCSKQEWRISKLLDKSKNPVQPNKYWSEESYKSTNHEGKEIEYKNNFLPKEVKEKPRPDLFKVLNKKLVGVERKSLHKHNITPTYDRHSKLQYITILPMEDKEGYIKQEKFIIKQQVPRYVYLKDSNGNICKKIFVEMVEKDVTIIRNTRIKYKTIVTKQYPNDLCNKRRIIKKNIELLRKQQEKDKKETENK